MMATVGARGIVRHDGLAGGKRRVLCAFRRDRPAGRRLSLVACVVRGGKGGRFVCAAGVFPSADYGPWSTSGAAPAGQVAMAHTKVRSVSLRALPRAHLGLERWKRVVGADTEWGVILHRFESRGRTRAPIFTPLL